MSAKDQAEVNDLFTKAQTLRNNPNRLAIASEAEELSRGYNTAGFFFEGQQRLCPDQELSQLFGAIASAAENLIELPSQPPLRRDVRIFDVFSMVGPILVSDDVGRDVGISRATVVPFVFFSILIDLVSMMGAMVHGMGRAQKICEMDLRQLHRTAWVLRNFFWEFPLLGMPDFVDDDCEGKCQAFVTVPLGGNPERTRQAEYLTALFDLSVDPASQFEPPVARRQEFEPWVQQLRLASGNASHYAVYPITSQETYETIKSLKRDALRALALNELPDNDFPEFSVDGGPRVVSLYAV